MTMNPHQARMLDPILTKHALGYKHADRVGHVLFPRVEVNQRGGTIVEFGKESFRKINMRRAPGSDTQQISFGHMGKPYQLVQDALDSAIPFEVLEDASAVPEIKMGMRAVNNIMQIMSLGLEIEQAEMATNPENYSDNNKETLTGTSRWSEAGSNPILDIEEAKDAVRSKAGIEPNRLVISKKVFRSLCQHPKIVDQFKYTSSDSITTKMLANYFDLEEVAVGKSMYADEATDDFKDVWRHSAVLAYVPTQPMGFEEPSYGYTYALKGHPYAEKPRYNGDKKSWIYGVTYDRAPVFSGADAGFLFSDPLGLNVN